MYIYFNDSLLNLTVERMLIIHWIICGFTENCLPTEQLKLFQNRFAIYSVVFYYYLPFQRSHMHPGLFQEYEYRVYCKSNKDEAMIKAIRRYIL